MSKIELLSPAKNLECGIEAINHGADAVYIGAPKFSARSAVGNSLHDIEALTTYAHKFNAGIYVALNTILTDKELYEAETLIWDLYNAGADAIIIQDMGIMQLNLPPIALHASTQTDNRTPEKVRFLQDAGFSQVVLARELSLDQIKEITSQVNVPIEVFVHGALCVSYSGQCYISRALGKRSANRGECAQYCRLPYDLKDADGNIIVKQKHLLSLKDLNLSEQLNDLINAGVSSFKIEGRLKDVGYVKNVTAFYRQKLDAILAGSDIHKKSSSGKTTFLFNPDLQKTFQRGFTTYFLNGRSTDITSFDTPKSKGEYIGKVKETGKNYLVLHSAATFQNGDGLCFLNKQGELCGFHINKTEGERIYPSQMLPVDKGTAIYRNLDHHFTQTLLKKSAGRKIGLNIIFTDTMNGFDITVTDEDNNTCTLQFDYTKEIARQAEKAMENIKSQLSKLGNTDYYLQNLDLKLSNAFFIPNSLLGEWRRAAIESLEQQRINNYAFNRKTVQPTTHPFPVDELTYLGNIYNEKAKEFYKQHGVVKADKAFEAFEPPDAILMFCKHCLKYSMGQCPKQTNSKTPFHEPYSLHYKNNTLKLEFDCKNCEMRIR